MLITVNFCCCFLHVERTVVLLLYSIARLCTTVFNAYFEMYTNNFNVQFTAYEY